MKRRSASCDRLLRVTADGAELIHETDDEVFWSIRWPDVIEIVAFKVDAITFDHLCIGLRRSTEPSFVVATEDTPGWKELNDQLLRTFAVAFDRWFGEVAFPAFAENRTVLWSIQRGSMYPPAEAYVDRAEPAVESFEVAFDGAILRRGFWLYVVEVRVDQAQFAYVGRTGDTSSPNAGSLFSRIASHLNPRANAKANSLLRHLDRQDLAWERCSYRFVGIGPVFPQEATMATHIPLRDEMAALERAVADVLKRRGYKILGNHPRRRPVRPDLLSAVLRQLEQLSKCASSSDLNRNS